jgi:hypothetical protein
MPTQFFKDASKPLLPKHKIVDQTYEYLNTLAAHRKNGAKIKNHTVIRQLQRYVHQYHETNKELETNSFIETAEALKTNVIKYYAKKQSLLERLIGSNYATSHFSKGVKDLFDEVKISLLQQEQQSRSITTGRGAGAGIR